MEPAGSPAPSPMTFQFRVGEEESLAFVMRFIHRSPAHRKSRMKVRWRLPAIMLALFAVQFYLNGFRPVTAAIYLTGSLLWFLFYPARYDRNIRENVKKQLRDPSQVKARGDYTLEISGEGLRSTSPVGSGFSSWAGVERAELTDDFLFIFLTGGSGHPIRRTQVGMEASQAAHDYVNEKAGGGGERPA